MNAPAVTTALTIEETTLLLETCDDMVVLEMGAELGYSTVCIAHVAHRLYSVDWHRGYKPGSLHGLGEQWTLPVWAQVVEKYHPGKVGRSVIGIIGEFETVLPLLPAGAFDVVFLDGGHEVAGLHAVIPEIRRLEPRRFITHDWGVPTCCEREVLTEYGWKPERIVGTMAVGGPL